MNHKIPKVIHQIWIGDRDMPDHCRRYVDKMKLLHQDWSVKLWGNEVFDLYSDDEFLNHWMTHPDPGGHLKWAYISDRIRLLLLRDFGGIYVDVDAQPIRSFNMILEELPPEPTFFAGMKQSQDNFTLIDCTVYGSAPNSRGVDIALSTYTDINHVNGCKMFCEKLIEEMAPDIALFGYRYFYNDNPDDKKCVVLHDVEGRLHSWGEPEQQHWNYRK
mgnify:CR=1 FL=1|jgi:hypothetical protein